MQNWVMNNGVSCFSLFMSFSVIQNKKEYVPGEYHHLFILKDLSLLTEHVLGSTFTTCTTTGPVQPPAP